MLVGQHLNLCPLESCRLWVHPYLSRSAPHVYFVLLGWFNPQSLIKIIEKIVYLKFKKIQSVRMEPNLRNTRSVQLVTIKLCNNYSTPACYWITVAGKGRILHKPQYYMSHKSIYQWKQWEAAWWIRSKAGGSKGRSMARCAWCYAD